MADDELRGLSREELLELVRRQQEELATREAAIERRDEKIRELEEELAQFRRPAKTPENSSVPPSRGQKASRVAGRRRKLGPKRGHVGVSRVRSEPDVVVECRPRVCAGCGQDLPQSGGRRTGRSQVVELPAFAPVVIEAWQYTVACEQCGEQTVGSYPTGLEPRRTFGPGVEALPPTSTGGTTSATSGWSRSVGTCSGSRSARVGSRTRWRGWSSAPGRPTPRSVRWCVAARSSTRTRPARA